MVPMPYETDAERIKGVSDRFPEGCRVRRKPTAKISNYSRPKEAVVSKVIMTGIHRDVFLKVGDFLADYLDPDAYEVF